MDKESASDLEAKKYLDSIGADHRSDRVLWARFLATQPSVDQVHIASLLALDERRRAKRPHVGCPHCACPCVGCAKCGGQQDAANE